MLQKLLRSALIACSVLLLIATPVAARDEPETRTDQHRTTTERIQGTLNETRRKNCEAHKNAINRIINHTAEQGQKHFTTFTTIMERIQNFYVKKGIDAPNYGTLAAEAETKKTAAQVAVDTVKAGVTIRCEGDNPIGQVDTFRGTIKTMHQALKDYRTAIKALGQAVKSAQATERNAQ